jgi:NADH-quinone oxidoreductase subunit M
VSSFPILTVTLVLPLAGAAALASIPKESVRMIRTIALLSTVVTFLVSLDILFRFHGGTGAQQLVEHVAWVPAAGASYKLGVDGISLWMVLLTTFLMPASVLVSYHVKDRVKAFFIVLLILESSLLGVFLSLDLALFYVFWEAMLVPMYFLIGIWGYDRRRYAAVKFFLYTLAGSLVMLVGILYLYSVSHSFDLTVIARVHLSGTAQDWLFWAFFASFAVKVPIFPLHTWLPDAHTEAPTAGSVLLAGVLLKMGAYGFLRFSIPLFPEAAHRYAPVLATLGVIGILYGGIVAVVQKDLKRLVAYSSVSHMGFVVLGIAALTPLATTGSVLVMLSHGLATGALFLLVGMLYDRAHTRQISEFRGVATALPVYAGLFLVVCLASLGLPGLSGFIGEFLVLNGTYPVDRVLAILGTGGVVLSAIYLLWAYERVFTGPTKLPHQERTSLWKDLSFRELAAVVPLLVMTLVIGVYPKPFLSRIEPSVRIAIHGSSTSPGGAYAPGTAAAPGAGGSGGSGGQP